MVFECSVFWRNLLSILVLTGIILGVKTRLWQILNGKTYCLLTDIAPESPWWILPGFVSWKSSDEEVSPMEMKMTARINAKQPIQLMFTWSSSVVWLNNLLNQWLDGGGSAPSPQSTRARRYHGNKATLCPIYFRWSVFQCASEFHKQKKIKLLKSF